MKNALIYTLVGIVIGLAIAGLIYQYNHTKSNTPTNSQQSNTGDKQTNTPPTAQNNNITVTNPLPNTQVTSPLTITGQAVGPWYFEASFPIKLYDANNTLLGQTTGQAQGNWQTTSFVPFTATLTFTIPTTSTGTLVLEKDNPSGEAQNADSITIPVTF